MPQLIHVSGQLFPAILLFSAFVFSLTKAWSILWNRARNANPPHLEVTAVPKIRGRLPGNLDILWQLIYDEAHGYCGETLLKWVEIYGPTYDMNILFSHQIVTADPVNVKHILATGFESFGKGEKFQAMFASFLGTGIFTTDGEAWKYHRAMARPFFSAERTSDFECFERHSSKVLDVMHERASRDSSFDIQARTHDASCNPDRTEADCTFIKDLFSRLTLDTGTDFLFGYSVNSIAQGVDNSDKSYNAFSEAFNIMSKIAMKRVRIGSTWRLFELWQEPTRNPMNTINAFVDPIVHASMTTRMANTDVKEQTFLEHLIKSTNDKKLIRDEILNILLAARDTTASLLTFVTYSLALHPEVARKLRCEIKQMLGERQTPTIIDIRDMKYLRAVINETLRLFPPVPFNIRRCVKQSMLPSPLSKTGPFRISPGISITYSPLIIQRRTDLWGDSACIFDPERWLQDAPKTHVTNPFSFLPFNGGPRMCLGQQFAYHECSYFVIRMLQAFGTLELAPDAQPAYSRPPKAWSESTIERKRIEKCWPQASLTLYSKGGLWIRTKHEE